MLNCDENNQNCKQTMYSVPFIHRYLVRRQLIESGMIEWLIDHLKQFLSKKSNLSCYGLEYSTALFMNLCLHRSGKLRCLPMAQEVLSTFLDLLSSTNKRQVKGHPEITQACLMGEGVHSCPKLPSGLEKFARYETFINQ